MTTRCNIPEEEILSYCYHCFLLDLNAWFCSEFKLDQPCTFESSFELTGQPTIRLHGAYIWKLTVVYLIQNSITDFTGARIYSQSCANLIHNTPTHRVYLISFLMLSFRYVLRLP